MQVFKTSYFFYFQVIGASSQGPAPSFMPAIGVSLTDDNDKPLTSTISIYLPNTAQNLRTDDNTTVNNNNTYSCANVTGLFTVDYILEIESPDTAWVIEINDG